MEDGTTTTMEGESKVAFLSFVLLATLKGRQRASQASQSVVGPSLSRIVFFCFSLFSSLLCKRRCDASSLLFGERKNGGIVVGRMRLGMGAALLLLPLSLFHLPSFLNLIPSAASAGACCVGSVGSVVLQIPLSLSSFLHLTMYMSGVVRVRENKKAAYVHPFFSFLLFLLSLPRSLPRSASL